MSLQPFLRQNREQSQHAPEEQLLYQVQQPLDYQAWNNSSPPFYREKYHYPPPRYEMRMLKFGKLGTKSNPFGDPVLQHHVYTESQNACSSIFQNPTQLLLFYDHLYFINQKLTPIFNLNQKFSILILTIATDMPAIC